MVSLSERIADIMLDACASDLRKRLPEKLRSVYGH